MNFDSVTIGVNSEHVATYLADIKSDVIDAAIRTLINEQDELFKVFRSNWKGVAERRFETNMNTASQNIARSLKQHYDALESKIISINNSWVKQDEEMVTEYRGANGGPGYSANEPGSSYLRGGF